MDWEGEGLWTPLSPTGILWNKKLYSDQGSVSLRGLLVASQTSAMWAQPGGAHSYKILLEVNVWLKNMKPRLYVHQNPGRSLFTLLFHFPSNQALAGNNPPRADYTGKIEQLFWPHLFPRKISVPGRKAACSQRIKMGISAYSCLELMVFTFSAERSCKRVPPQSVTRFLSRIKKLALIASRLFLNTGCLPRSWEPVSRCFGVSKGWHSLLLICMSSVRGDESLLQE